MNNWTKLYSLLELKREVASFSKKGSYDEFHRKIMPYILEICTYKLIWDVSNIKKLKFGLLQPSTWETNYWSNWFKAGPAWRNAMAVMSSWPVKSQAGKMSYLTLRQHYSFNEYFHYDITSHMLIVSRYCIYSRSRCWQ